MKLLLDTHILLWFQAGDPALPKAARPMATQSGFAVLMEATKYCSLGQLTAAMFEVGGQYRRNM
jgi:methylmalonyl-CoA mutase